jgi:hypothetical protein
LEDAMSGNDPRKERKRIRNNEYRRECRAAARLAGSVYRMGRGRPETKAATQKAAALAAKKMIFERLGHSICIRCGFSDVRALQLDHKHGGGRKHRLSLPSGNTYLRRLLALSLDQLTETFQILCANCNTIKRIENNENRRSGKGPAQSEEGIKDGS